MTASWWPTALDGDPEACVHASETLTTMGRHLSAAAGALEGARSTATVPWVGLASAAAGSRVTWAQAACGHLTDQVGALARALTRLAHELAAVRSSLREARVAAIAAGLPATAAGFAAPSAHPAVSLVECARRQEHAAHAEFRSAVGHLMEGGAGERFATSVIADVLHLPPSGGDLVDDASWLVGLPGAAGLIPEARRRSLHRAGDDLVARLAVSELPSAAGLAAAATRSLPLVVRAAKASGPAGDALTVLSAGRDQWRADRDDQRLTVTDRVGRTAVRAALEGGGAIAGGLAGAQMGSTAGMVIGSAVPVIGTAAGAAVGAAFGAAVGSFVATEAGGGAVDAAVEGVDDVIDLAGGAAAAVTDRVETAAAVLCRWR